MNNQPLPKPSQVAKTNDLKNSGSSMTPPPSALNKNLNKKEVVFDGNKDKSRIPLAQKQDQNQNKAQSQKTVLGAPIPQTIRGEKLPVGLTASPSYVASVPVLSKTKTKTLVQPVNKLASSAKVSSNLASPTPASSSSSTTVAHPVINQEKTSPVPVAPNRDIVKGSGDINSKSKDKPKFVSEKKSVLKFLPLIVGGVAVLAVVGLIVSKLFGSKKTTPLPSENNNAATSSTSKTAGSEKRTEVPAEQKELVYWGLWEPNEVIQAIIDDFESANPGVKVTYVKQSHKDYRERLQTALESGKGPDIFRFHASWTPMLKSNLYPIPSSVVSSKEFKDNYYPIVTDQLVVGGQYVGVPLMYDGLALYYNEDILESASETPPSTWAELRLLASKLTVKSANGIERAGLAVGNTENVDHFADIFAILMLQNGADFTKPNSQETKDALLFYTNFVLKDGVWDEKLPSSTVAFARGDVAMMFAPSWRAHEILAQNPSLKFKTMPLPQLSDKRITWGSYWAEGINSGSKNKDIASKFVGFLSSDKNLMKLFSKASEVRSFGEIYPKVNMAEKLASNGIVASYLDDAVYAKGWYLNSFTHDNGINDQMIEYYKDGINAVLEGKNIDDVLVTIENGTKQLLKQYGVSSR